MWQFFELLDEKDLVCEITALIDQRRYQNALALIRRRLSAGIDICIQQGVYLKAALAGLLIDIGGEGCIGKAAQEGIEIYETLNAEFRELIAEGCIEYNLGNGKLALFRVRRGEDGFEFKPESVELLTEAKNHYWRAYKLFGVPDDRIRPQLLVNLANSLSSSGRIAEALQYYDLVLRDFPGFPQASANRADALLWLSRLSDSYSVNMLWQAMQGYSIASEASDSPSWITDQWKEKCLNLKHMLHQHGYSEEDAAKDVAETEAEFEPLSDYRRFCLHNHLTVSEHSLYCKCIGSRRDDLTVPKVTRPIAGDFVPRMEYVLNRLKSEFALARFLYYQALLRETDRWETYNDEVTFTELYEGEAIGTRSEMTRTSFRMCFGILDKIGRAICDLFDLADPDEPIYFESFWRPRGKALSNKQKGRWPRLNSIRNFPLLALYSQATDLNSHSGEWGIFKAWRNALEHGMMMLSYSKEAPLDPYGVLKDNQYLQSVHYDDFVEKTLHFLRLTRSAIFNFTFCARHEGTKHRRGGDGTHMTIRFDHKQS